VRAVRNTARLLKMRSEAEDVLIVAEDAEADPRLYRDPKWWGRLLKEAHELYRVLPIAQETRGMLDKLAGKKTYIVAALSGVVFVAWTLGYIDDKTADSIMLFLGVNGLATLRAGMRKAEQ
jgi:hypothetical protein